MLKRQKETLKWIEKDYETFQIDFNFWITSRTICYENNLRYNILKFSKILLAKFLVLASFNLYFLGPGVKFHLKVTLGTKSCY